MTNSRLHPPFILVDFDGPINATPGTDYPQERTEGCIKYLQRLKRDGWFISVVTARPVNRTLLGWLLDLVAKDEPFESLSELADVPVDVINGWYIWKARRWLDENPGAYLPPVEWPMSVATGANPGVPNVHCVVDDRAAPFCGQWFDWRFVYESIVAAFYRLYIPEQKKYRARTGEEIPECQLTICGHRIPGNCISTQWALAARYSLENPAVLIQPAGKPRAPDEMRQRINVGETEHTVESRPLGPHNVMSVAADVRIDPKGQLKEGDLT